MKKLQIYLDTSIISHLNADDAPDMRDITIEFFNNYVKTGKYDVFISPIVIDELKKTTNINRREELLKTIKKYPLKIINTEFITNEIQELAAIYIEKEIIPKKKIEDALHIAITTIEELDILLSWNFRHLANINKEMHIHAANILMGYMKEFRMITPMEVITDDE